jgi:opacity protein-like surface antigen
MIEDCGEGTPMRNALASRRLWILALTALILAATARHANAQGFISPFIGYNFSGDSGCPEITNCKDKHANYGASFGALGSIVGFEAEIAYTSDFFGATANQSTNVLTFMSNFMLAPKFGPIQPYGLAGVGLMRTTIESVGQNNDTNQVAWDAGGGLMAFFNEHIGVRGDVRYYHSFEVLDALGLTDLGIRQTKLDFGRFSIAAVFKF